jgi:hypothetical protein
VQRSWLALGTLLAACGARVAPHGPVVSPDGMLAADGGEFPGTDGGPTPDSDGYQMAAHPPFPQITMHSTPAFSAPQLVTITYDQFAFRDQVEQFGDFVLTSQWYGAVGKEYGVTGGVHLKKVRLPSAAPKSITDSAIVTLLKQLASAGTIPAPSAQNDQLVYLVYLPSTTKIDDGTGAILCADAYLGYHYADALKGAGSFTYAVLPDCTGNLDDLTSTASHEIIEAATDPEDGWFLDVSGTDLWSGDNGEEVADLCEDDANVEESGWALQRSWSNQAALTGGSPCVPVPAGEVFNDVSVDPSAVPRISAGASTTFTLTGWSTAPMSDWSLLYAVSSGADFEPMVHFSSHTINNATQVMVTLTVPPGTVQGKLGSIDVYSGTDGGNFWPITLISN